MRARSLLLALALLFVACGKATSVKGINTANNPVAPTGTAASFTGTWVGTMFDTSGTLMGSGLGGTSFIWQLTENGSQVSGTIVVQGGVLTPGQPVPVVNGTVTGSTMSFTVTITPSTTTVPGMISTPCSGIANGTMTLDPSGNALTGTYTGTNSCSGAFASGQVALTRQ